MTATDAITCPTCGHIWTAERVRDYADQLQIPTMVLRGKLRQRGCDYLGTRHLVTGEPSPMTYYPPVKAPAGSRSRRRSRRGHGKRYRWDGGDTTHGATYGLSGDVLAAYRDATGKPRGWQP